MLASIENIYKIYNGEEILSDISLTIENTERIGLVGVNGCGKTTLLSIITGKTDFDKTPDGKGSVSISNGVRIGYLEQHTGLEGDASIADEMRLPFKALDEEYERMQELERKLSSLSGEALEEAEAEYSLISSHYENNDGYIIDDEENVRIRLAKIAYTANIYNVVEKEHEIKDIKNRLKKVDRDFLLGMVNYYRGLCSRCCNANDGKDAEYYILKAKSRGFSLASVYLNNRQIHFETSRIERKWLS